MSKAIDRAKWLAERCHDLADQYGGPADAKSLLQDRSRGELKAIPATGNTESGIGIDARNQSRVSS
jgi:hypothetical protein